jgi:hypothetical protein
MQREKNLCILCASTVKNNCGSIKSEYIPIIYGLHATHSIPNLAAKNDLQ